MKTAMMIFLMLASFGITLGQTTEFTYQGRLTESASPATGNYDFEFTLFDGATGGNPTPTLLRPNVPVTSGIFSVRLNFGEAYPAFTYLEIKVRPSSGGAYTTLSPRHQLASVPTAVRSLRAGEADLFGGQPIANFVLEGDARLSDARSPLAGSSNYIQNSTGMQDPASFNISGNGAAAGTLTASAISAGTQVNVQGSRVLTVTTGSSAFLTNTFTGVEAGNANPTGTFNSLYGNGSGRLLAGGQNNSFFGSGSGGGTVSGNENSFYGRNTGAANTASRNSFFGSFAGASNTSGTQNSFFGRETGRLNTTGNHNSFFGNGGSSGSDGTGYNNTSGSFNSFFGHRTGEGNTTGSVNSFFGTGAGFANTVGEGNTFIGHDAGNANVDGSFNTVVGRGADVSTGSLAWATAIGANATVATDDTIVIGKAAGTYCPFPCIARPADTVIMPGTLNIAGGLSVNGSPTFGGTLTASGLDITGNAIARSEFTTEGRFNAGAGGSRLTVLANGNVGIGDAAPTATLQVNGESFFSNGPFTVVSNQLQFRALSGNGNMFIAPAGSARGINFGVAGGPFNDATLFISQFDGTTYQDRIVVDSSGSVGIGPGIDTNYKLNVNGALRVVGPTSTQFTVGTPQGLCAGANSTIGLCVSSRQYKENINGFNAGLDLIRKLRPVTFNWKSDGQPDVGLVAEEVGEVEPLLALFRDGKINGVKYDRIGVIAVNAIKEQQEQIERQQKMIEDLKTQLETLRRAVCSQTAMPDLCKPQQ